MNKQVNVNVSGLTDAQYNVRALRYSNYEVVRYRNIIELAIVSKSSVESNDDCSYL